MVFRYFFVVCMALGAAALWKVYYGLNPFDRFPTAVSLIGACILSLVSVLVLLPKVRLDKPKMSVVIPLLIAALFSLKLLLA